MVCERDSRPRVLLIDDHRMVRDAIAALLENSGLVQVVGRLDTADDAITEVQRLHPQLVLMDVEMPGRSAFDVARALLALRPPPLIAFLTAHEHPSYHDEARRIGAAGFLHKTSSPESLISAISHVLLGEWVFERSMEPQSKRLSLTPRELEVLTYIGHGLNTKEMASTMCLSPRTVERHVERLMERVGVHDRLKLALLAMNEGLVSSPAAMDAGHLGG